MLAVAPLAAAAPEAPRVVAIEGVPAAVIDALLRRGLEPVKQLGVGAFGRAILVRSFSEAEGVFQKFVAKVIDLTGMKKEERRLALGEVEVLRRLSHPNVVGYEGSFLDSPSNTLVIVLEFADGGDLAQAIKKAKAKGRFFAENRILFWFCQLASALRYCHEQKILHRCV